MICSLSAIINFLRIASAMPSIPSESLELEKIKQLGASGSPEVERNNVLSLSVHENEEKHNSNLIVTDLDNSHIKRVFESKKDGPFFWENESFQSNTHVCWKSINYAKRKRSEISILEKVHLIQVDCSALRKDVKYNRKLRCLINTSNNQAAHMALDLHLLRIERLLIGLFHPEKQGKFGDMSSIHQLDHELKWWLLLQCIPTGIDELKYIFLNSWTIGDWLKREHFHALTTQIFEILNFFIKNNLLHEKIYEDWFEDEGIKDMMLHHITDTFYEPTFMSPYFHDSLLRSISTEHLVFALEYLEKDSLIQAEYVALRQKVGYTEVLRQDMKSEWIYGKFELLSVARSFLEAGFQNVEEITREKKNVLDDIVHYLNKSTELASPDVFLPRNIIQREKCGLVYDMLCFVIKYHSQLLREYFSDEEAIHLFDIKVKILDSAITYLRSVRELEIVRADGFWTADIPSLKSKSQISSQKAEEWSPFPNKGVEYFKKNFRFYIPKDVDRWKMILARNSLHRSDGLLDNSEGFEIQKCISLICDSFSRIIKPKIEYECQKPHEYRKIQKNPIISKVLQNDINSWVERFQYTVERTRINKKIWTQIFTRITSSEEKCITDSIKSELSTWLIKSDIIRYVTSETSSILSKSERAWKVVRREIEMINQNIVSSIVSSQEKSSHLISGAKNKNSDLTIDYETPTNDNYHTKSGEDYNQHGLKLFKIPNIKF